LLQPYLTLNSKEEMDLINMQRYRKHYDPKIWKLCSIPSKRVILARNHNTETARRVFKKTFFELMHELNGSILDAPSMPKTAAEFKVLISTQMRLLIYHIWTKLSAAFDHYLTESDKQMYMALYCTIMENIHEIYGTITTEVEEEKVTRRVKDRE